MGRAGTSRRCSRSCSSLEHCQRLLQALGRRGGVAEISRLDLPADLVVLSACETALGPSVRGEGTIGLAWSFLYAGARRVVASLWRIDDRRTAAFMTRFLELHHRGRLPVAAALRRAQLEAIARPGATANDWAGFVLVGDWREPDPAGPEEGS